MARREGDKMARRRVAGEQEERTMYSMRGMLLLTERHGGKGDA